MGSAMMVFHAISKKILSNCHSVKSEPMLMNYEKCDQVLFPLLQQKPGPSSLKEKKIVAPYSRKKINYILPTHPPLFSKLHIRLMNPIVQIGKIKIAPQKTLSSLPMFYNYYIVNVIIILCQLTRFFVHRVCESHHKKIEKYIVSRKKKKKKKNNPKKKKKKKKKKKS